MSESNNNHGISDQRLMQVVAEVSPAGILVINSEGAIVYVNPQVLTWLGYSEEELLGQQLEVLVPEQVRRYHVGLRKHYARAPKHRTMAQEKELFARGKDGSQFPVDISLHPIESEGQRFVLASIMDATQRRRAAQVPQERLNAIGEMISGLAHESRNALQRARASLDLLELDLESEDHTELLGRIRRSLEDLEHNFDEVRNYASPILLDIREVDVYELIQEVVDDISITSVGFPDVTIESDPDGQTNFVDRYRLKQVLRNCLENAIQAGEGRDNYIRFHVYRCEQDAGWQVIEIADQGAGLTEDVAARMFEPFYTTKQKGTGLGLAICRRIVEAHQGIVSAFKNPDGGATIVIRLPYRH